MVGLRVKTPDSTHLFWPHTYVPCDVLRVGREGSPSHRLEEPPLSSQLKSPNLFPFSMTFVKWVCGVWDYNLA